jgi:PrgI family protein
MHYNREMQFQVPQFIETEDKIVGPLSLRQFIYVGVGVGFAALLYFILQFWIWVILAFIFVGAAVALAFVKVEGRPLVNVVVSAFNFYWHPQTYIWQPEHPALPKATQEAPAKKPETSTLQKIAAGMALHKSWQNVQTGEKISDKQFTERKMYAKYQILQRVSGERRAAKRVDYR